MAAYVQRLIGRVLSAHGLPVPSLIDGSGSNSGRSVSHDVKPSFDGAGLAGHLVLPTNERGIAGLFCIASDRFLWRDG